jgi:hypothetical protein
VQFTKYSSPLHNVRMAQENCPIHTKSLLRFFRITVRLVCDVICISLRLHNLRMTRKTTHCVCSSQNCSFISQKCWSLMTRYSSSSKIQLCTSYKKQCPLYTFIQLHNGSFMSHNDQSLVSAPLNFTKYQKNILVRNSLSPITPRSANHFCMLGKFFSPSYCFRLLASEPSGCIAVMRPNILQRLQLGI